MRQVYVAALLSPGAEAQLEGDDYTHLTRSLRAKIGEPLRIVDGAFSIFSGQISAIDRRSVTLRATQALPDEHEPAPLRLGLCVPAQDAFDAALDAAVQLGVTEFVPLHSSRSRQAGEGKLARWQRIVRESCCQCLRARPPKIAAAAELASFLSSEASALKFVAWQEASLACAPALNGATTLVVGPEGGFENEEIEMARASGWQFLNLGPHVLRVPVAVAAGLGLIQSMRAA